MSGRIRQTSSTTWCNGAVRRGCRLTGSTFAKAGREYKARCPSTAKNTVFLGQSTEGFLSRLWRARHGTRLPDGVRAPRLSGGRGRIGTQRRHRGLRADSEPPSTEPLLAMLEKAAQLHPAAVDYLKARGPRPRETAREFGIGYAPRWLGYPAHDPRPDPETDRQHLLAAGLVIARDTGGFYDRFRERIMFPIRDTRGVSSPSAAASSPAANPIPELAGNSAVSQGPRAVWPATEARRGGGPSTGARRQGYMDVMMLAAHRIHYAAGTLGTATATDTCVGCLA